MTKKLISVLLSILLVFTVTASVFAAGDAAERVEIQLISVEQTEDGYIYAYYENGYTATISPGPRCDVKEEVADDAQTIQTEDSFVILDETEEDDVQIVQTEDGYTNFYFEDGSTVSVSPAILEEASVDPLTGIKTFNHSKTATVTDSNGVLQCSFTLSYFEGVYTSTSHKSPIYESGWTITSGSCTVDGASAIGTGTFTYLSSSGNTITRTVGIKMTCDVHDVIT